MKIYSEITNKEIEEAMSGKIERLWDLCSTIEGDKEFEKEIEKIKWGIKIKFDIRSIIENFYQMDIAFGQVKIERKNIINITEFRDELDKRKMLMKDILRSLYDNTFDNQREEEIEGFNNE